MPSFLMFSKTLFVSTEFFEPPAELLYVLEHCPNCAKAFWVLIVLLADETRLVVSLYVFEFRVTEFVSKS